MTNHDVFIKRAFDIVIASLGLLTVSPIILTSWIIAAVETRSNGFFFQKRVGRDGELFRLVKIKSMWSSDDDEVTCVTTSRDLRITRSGAFFRKFKIDELPQLWNVLRGEMSLVGPRPDVPGFADLLEGDDRLILSVRPGITGPASVLYKNEEEILSRQENPEEYNSKIIYPNKVKINKNYIANWSFFSDINIIIKTLF